MKQNSALLMGLAISLLLPSFVSAQSKFGVLTGDQVKKVVPSVYFFRGQSATVQLRNSAGFTVAGGKYVLAGLVDTSGYSTDVAAKYQGFLITEVQLNIEGVRLAPGQYGFGFSKQGKFLVMDVGAHDLFSVATQHDEKLARPVPLKIIDQEGTYRLYSGRDWVELKVSD